MTAGAAVDNTLHAVADSTRRAILRLLRDGETAAGDIAAGFSGISRPAVSQHLRVLADAGLVEVRRDGRRRIYKITGEPIGVAARELDQLWLDRLGRLKAAAEQAEMANKR